MDSETVKQHLLQMFLNAPAGIKQTMLNWNSFDDDLIDYYFIDIEYLLGCVCHRVLGQATKDNINQINQAMVEILLLGNLMETTIGHRHEDFIK